MKTLIQGGRIINPAKAEELHGDVAIAAGRVVAIGQAPADFSPQRIINAKGRVVMPGLVDLAVRLREPGQEHARMLESELAAAVAGGVTSLVCPPDTDPTLDEAGLVEMLRFRAEKLQLSRVLPLGALTRGLKGEVITEMMQLNESGCVGFSQVDVPVADTQVLSRAIQYANTFGFSIWLRPQDLHLGKGVAASGALATRLGLSGVPVAAETIALYTIFELIRGSDVHIHLCRISSAAGLELIRQAKAQGLNVTCDVSINSLHLTEMDIGYYDPCARLTPPLRQAKDRDALSQGLMDGTVDALVSDHNPVDADAKNLPFAQAEPGATGVELLLSLAVKWAKMNPMPLSQALAKVTSQPAKVLGSHVPPGLRAWGESSLGELKVGGLADICMFDEQGEWIVQADALTSQGKHTPFLGYSLPAVVEHTWVGGHLAYSRFKGVQ